MKPSFPCVYTNEKRKVFHVGGFVETFKNGKANYGWPIDAIYSKGLCATKNSEDSSNNHTLDNGVCVAILTNKNDWAVEKHPVTDNIAEEVRKLREEWTAKGYTNISARARKFENVAGGDELSKGWNTKPPKTKKGIDNLISRFEEVTGRDCSAIRGTVLYCVTQADSDMRVQNRGFKRIPQSRGEETIIFGTKV